jgi:hypothetical protein
MPQPNLTELDRLVGEAERSDRDLRQLRLNKAYRTGVERERIERLLKRSASRKNRRVAKMIAALEEVPL